jgi:hypothetical protein
MIVSAEVRKRRQNTWNGVLIAMVILKSLRLKLNVC